MPTSISAVLGLLAAVAWFLYVTSLPVRIGLAATHRDASTIAIGVGVFFVMQVIAAPRRPLRWLLPAARVRSNAAQIRKLPKR